MYKKYKNMYISKRFGGSWWKMAQGRMFQSAIVFGKNENLKMSLFAFFFYFCWWKAQISHIWQLPCCYMPIRKHILASENHQWPDHSYRNGRSLKHQRCWWTYVYVRFWWEKTSNMAGLMKPHLSFEIYATIWSR